MKMVLQKFIAGAGYCSRRRATELIKAGKVKVNGQAAEAGRRVDEEDQVEIGGKRLRLAEKKIYIKLNKPAGYVCTNRKFKDEKNVFELLRGGAGHVETRPGASLHVAGRLDKNSRGLVLLTNDGELTEKLTHPRFGHKKSYEVRVKNYEPGDENRIINKLKTGIDIGEGDGIVKAKEAKYLGNNKFEIILAEGKKRQIRRMFKALGLEIADLKRTAIGKIRLGNLAEGKWQYIKKTDLT